MPDYLPDDPVVDINAVIYQYTTIKQTEDDMLVHVQNKDTRGNGYIFRETDDWSGLPSGSINKLVPVDNIPAEYFGEGSIEVEGTGQVVSSSVRYNYRIDTSVVTPDLSYVPEPVETEVYSALDDSAVQDAMKSTDSDQYDSEEEEDKDERTEKALSAAESALAMAGDISQAALLQAMNMATNINQYYAASISGGVYKDVTVLMDSKLPENRNGLRNGLAQQILHTKLVDMQYR